MSETQTGPALNGQQPGPAAEAPCEDCSSAGERILAVLAAVIGVGILVVAIDMFTGGRLSGYVREQAAQVTEQAQ